MDQPHPFALVKLHTDDHSIVWIRHLRHHKFGKKAHIALADIKSATKAQSSNKNDAIRRRQRLAQPKVTSPLGTNFKNQKQEKNRALEPPRLPKDYSTPQSTSANSALLSGMSSLMAELFNFAQSGQIREIQSQKLMFYTRSLKSVQNTWSVGWSPVLERF